MIIEIDGKEIEVSDEYSFKNFTNRLLKEEKNLKGAVIYNSSFYNEQPDSDIFPRDLEGTTFINCLMDNLIIPEGVNLINCSTKKFAVQKDLRDWSIDTEGAPVEVLDKAYWEKEGYSVSPEDIPEQKLGCPEDIKKAERINGI